jgi:hypothetical protein
LIQRGIVVFDLRPGTGGVYSWPLGETALEIPLSDLPVIDQMAAAAFLAEIGPTSGQKHTAVQPCAGRLPGLGIRCAIYGGGSRAVVMPASAR